MIEDAVHTLLFYFTAISSLLLALITVTNRRLLRAAVGLMGVLILTSAFYLLLDAEFLAGVQILVYVGGIVVLMVFAIMLTQRVDLREDLPSPGRRKLALLVSLGLILGPGLICVTAPFPVDTTLPRVSDHTLEIGKALLDPGAQGFVLPFEIISLLLLAAAVGGIVIARKTPPEHQPLTTGGDLPNEYVSPGVLNQHEHERSAASHD